MNKEIIFKTPLPDTIVIAAVVSTLVPLVVFYINKNPVFVGLSVLVLLLITFFYVFLFRKIVVVNSSGITSINKVSTTSISWNDLKSISLHSIVNDTLRYEVLSSQGMKIIPYVSNHLKFEELFIKYGSLEQYADGSPFISKRWNVKGKPYEYTSAFDHMNDMTFAGTKNSS